ncbi:unnamed protein product [Cunninghamella echinulata]
MLYLFQRYYIKCTYSIIKQHKHYFTTETKIKTITTTINSTNNNNILKDSIKKNIDTNLLSLKTAIKNKDASLVFHQCSGKRKKDGLPCTRKIAVDINEAPFKTFYYCHTHRPTSLLKREDIAYSPATEKILSIQTPPLHDCWSLWIKDHITKKKCGNEYKKKCLNPFPNMMKLGPKASTNSHCYFKIGRAKNPIKRMVQVANQCHYIPSLLDILPSDEKRIISYCPISHRVEKLIHLELSYLFTPNTFQCTGCGQSHREWIRVKRPFIQDTQGNKVLMTDHQVYVEKIRPIVLHWIQYGLVVSLTTQQLNSSLASALPSSSSSSSSLSESLVSLSTSSEPESESELESELKLESELVLELESKP